MEDRLEKLFQAKVKLETFHSLGMKIWRARPAKSRACLTLREMSLPSA